MPPEAVLICGIQGAGKSTLVRERCFDTHVRISRDLLRSANRERRFSSSRPWRDAESAAAPSADRTPPAARVA